VIGVYLILRSIFFYKLSLLSNQELRDSSYIDFNFWFDYLVWVSFILLATYLYFIKPYSEGEISMKRGLF